MKITKVKSNEIIFEDDSNTMKQCVINAVKKGADLRGADLRDANLGDANLGGAYLRGAYLRGAYLRDANLGGANLGGAYLVGADLRDAYLVGADLRDAYLVGADLRGANLRGANLRGAYLGGANLRGANLRDAYLRDAKELPFIPLACPSDGEFIGWKKVENKLIQLLIPCDARRSSATSNKCRCDKAKVISITDLDGSHPIESITNNSYTQLTYIVGEYVFPDEFDEDRWNECSHGIHFFINKQEAINY